MAVGEPARSVARALGGQGHDRVGAFGGGLRAAVAVEVGGGVAGAGHVDVGPVRVDCDVLTDGDAELKIVILTAAAGTEAETKLRLATVAMQLSS